MSGQFVNRTPERGGDTLLERSRLVKNAAVLRFFCAERLKESSTGVFQNPAKCPHLSQAGHTQAQGKQTLFRRVLENVGT